MISWASFLTILGMLAATYSTRLIGFLALRHRTLSSRAAAGSGRSSMPSRP